MEPQGVVAVIGEAKVFSSVLLVARVCHLIDCVALVDREFVHWVDEGIFVDPIRAKLDLVRHNRASIKL